jgi:CRP-like cAMP-binding protein
VILEAGAPIEDIYFPLTGMISMLVVNSDGRPVETSTVGREGALGLQAALGKRRSFTRATAQIGGQFSTIRAARLNRIVNGNGSVRDLIARYTELLWAESQQNAACNAVHDCTARLCRWLLQSADHINSPTLPLTQEFLAQMLSVRRTTVTLLARALQARGIIR